MGRLGIIQGGFRSDPDRRRLRAGPAGSDLCSGRRDPGQHGLDRGVRSCCPDHVVHCLEYGAGGTPNRGRPVTLLLDRSDLFGVNILVTIYYAERMGPRGDEVYERQIGVGRVSNVQQNGLIQVLVLVEASGHSDLWQRIRKRETATLSQVVVKPLVSFTEAGVEVRLNE